MSAVLDEIIAKAKQSTFEILARPGAFNWSKDQKLGEFRTQFRRIAKEFKEAGVMTISAHDWATINQLINVPESWADVGVLKTQLPPIPELQSMEIILGQLGGLLKQINELSSHSEVTVNRIINLKERVA